MDFVYFPFSFVSEQECREISACFKQWSVWMPSAFRIPPHMQELSDNNLLSLVFPFGDKDEFIAPTLNHLERWADTHGHGHLRQSLRYGENQNRQTESSVYHILDAINADMKLKADGLGAKQNGSESTAEGKWVQKRRIFLQIAQAFDQHEQAIQNGMDMVTALEHHFQEILHATQEANNSNMRQATTERDLSEQTYMLSERLEAWLCFLAAPGYKHSQTESPIYVTASSAIEKLLIDALPDASPAIQINHIPVTRGEDKDSSQWRQSFFQWLGQWIGATEADASHAPQPPRSASDCPTVSLSIYRANMPVDRWVGQVLEEAPLVFGGEAGTQGSTILASVRTEYNLLTN